MLEERFTMSSSDANGLFDLESQLAELEEKWTQRSDAILFLQDEDTFVPYRVSRDGNSDTWNFERYAGYHGITGGRKRVMSSALADLFINKYSDLKRMLQQGFRCETSDDGWDNWKIAPNHLPAEGNGDISVVDLPFETVTFANRSQRGITKGDLYILKAKGFSEPVVSNGNLISSGVHPTVHVNYVAPEDIVEVYIILGGNKGAFQSKAAFYRQSIDPSYKLVFLEEVKEKEFPHATRYVRLDI